MFIIIVPVLALKFLFFAVVVMLDLLVFLLFFCKLLMGLSSQISLCVCNVLSCTACMVYIETQHLLYYFPECLLCAILSCTSFLGFCASKEAKKPYNCH